MDELQSRSERYAEVKNHLHLPGIEPRSFGFPACSQHAVEWKITQFFKAQELSHLKF
jgi:hypothetical protein